jgi:hypothetical protein
MHRRLAQLCAAFLLLYASAASLATQIEARSLPELGREAQLVVQGKVRGTRSFWNEDRSRILTEVEFEVAQAHKGQAPTTLRLLQMGGAVDGVRMTMHGAPQWKQEQQMLLFLEPATRDAYRLSGFTQGRFELTPDARTGELMAKRSLFGAELVGQKDATVLELSLTDLLSQALLNGEGQ